ncbi:MAG: hypothetical protein M3M96_03065 [Candidatus Eremiobacteraeota bacterium]|nr:hypothetical protein [Candidatus Eremiobacteraeota bacterium]
MRCRALATQLSARGHIVEFLKKAPAAGCDVLIVDSYMPGPGEFEQWAEQTSLVVIDDLADRNLDFASVVLNQNFGAANLPYAARRARMLLGPQFALLREQFRRPNVARSFSQDDNRVLVTLGGGPVEADLRRILDQLETVDRPLEITVLGGAAGPWRSRHAVRFVRTDEVAALMLASDVCISGGGVTTLELAATGTPAIVVVMAQNQEPAAAALMQLDAAVIAGPMPVAMGRVAADVSELLSFPQRRESLSRRASVCVDGEGPRRVAVALEEEFASTL